MHNRHNNFSGLVTLFLSNAYYMYEIHNKPHCKEHERVLRINSNKLGWSSSSKPPFEATSIFSSPPYYTTNRKKEKCCQNIQTLFQEPTASRIEVWVSVMNVPINQRCMLTRAFTCFIRTLVCFKKKHHHVLKRNNLLSNNAFWILKLLYSSDFVYRKRNYN